MWSPGADSRPHRLVARAKPVSAARRQTHRHPGRQPEERGRVGAGENTGSPHPVARSHPAATTWSPGRAPPPPLGRQGEARERSEATNPPRGRKGAAHPRSPGADSRPPPGRQGEARERSEATSTRDRQGAPDETVSRGNDAPAFRSPRSSPCRAAFRSARSRAAGRTTLVVRRRPTAWDPRSHFDRPTR